jgi:RNA polymerase primary sigma factor
MNITKQITSRDTESLSKYLKDVNNISNLLTPEEEVALTIKIQSGCQKSLYQLIKSNLRFVISVAKQYQIKGVVLDDLIAEGNIGLMIAAKRFDHTKGFRFISYAVWWIRQRIQSYLNENSRLVRIPVNKLSLINKIKKATNKLEQENQSEVDVSQIINAMEQKLSAIQVSSLLSINKQHVSLDNHIHNDEGTSTLLDRMPSEEQEEFDVNKTDTKVNSLFSVLSPREKICIAKSFGLNGIAPSSIEELALEFERTPSMIRIIIARGIRKLRWKAKKNDGSFKNYIN